MEPKLDRTERHSIEHIWRLARRHPTSLYGGRRENGLMLPMMFSFWFFVLTPAWQGCQCVKPVSCISQLLIPAVPASNTNHISLKSMISSSSTYSMTSGYAGPQSVLSCATSLSTSRHLRAPSTTSCRILRRSSRLGAGVLTALRATRIANAISSA